MISIDQLLDVVTLAKENSVELIITGRKAHAKLIQVADLVTEMQEIKHYFNDGVKARRGIEY